MKTLPILVAALALLGISAVHAEEPDVASYIRSSTYPAGWVNITTPQEGMHIYTQPTIDTRRKTQAFSVGRPERQTYSFFSAQEEEALWLLREKKNLAIAASLNESGPRRSLHHRHTLSASSIGWPKVLVRGDEICVPMLEHSDSKDWAEHLKCWSREAAHVQ